MSDDFLSRWSRLKRASAPAPAEAVERPAEAKEEPRAAPPPAARPAGSAPAAAPQEPLPAIESLTFESDFAAFMKPEVDGLLKRQALKTLFQDPRFNVMDGLDVYIDDFSKPDPLPDGWLEKMNLSRLGDYRPPLEEASQPVQPVPEALEKDASKEALAASPAPSPADTLEAPPMPPPVPESGPRP